MITQFTSLVTSLTLLPGFDRRRRDPLWRISEKISGEDKITKRAADLFYEKIDGLIQKRIEAVANGYKPDPDAGVDILDMFMQSETNPWKLGGMVFSFLSAGREYDESNVQNSILSIIGQVTPPHSASPG